MVTVTMDQQTNYQYQSTNNNNIPQSNNYATVNESYIRNIAKEEIYKEDYKKYITTLLLNNTNTNKYVTKDQVKNICAKFVNEHFKRTIETTVATEIKTQLISETPLKNLYTQITNNTNNFISENNTRLDQVLKQNGIAIANSSANALKDFNRDINLATSTAITNMLTTNEGNQLVKHMKKDLTIGYTNTLIASGLISIGSSLLCCYLYNNVMQQNRS